MGIQIPILASGSVKYILKIMDVKKYLEIIMLILVNILIILEKTGSGLKDMIKKISQRNIEMIFVWFGNNHMMNW